MKNEVVFNMMFYSNIIIGLSLLSILYIFCQSLQNLFMESVFMIIICTWLTSNPKQRHFQNYCVTSWWSPFVKEVWMIRGTDWQSWSIKVVVENTCPLRDSNSSSVISETSCSIIRVQKCKVLQMFTTMTILNGITKLKANYRCLNIIIRLNRDVSSHEQKPEKLKKEQYLCLSSECAFADACIICHVT